MFSSLGGNRLFASCLKPKFQSEAKCETFHMKMSFHSLENKTHFHIKGFALGLAMKQRQMATRKWPIQSKRFLPMFLAASPLVFKAPPAKLPRARTIPPAAQATWILLRLLTAKNLMTGSLAVTVRLPKGTFLSDYENKISQTVRQVRLFKLVRML